MPGTTEEEADIGSALGVLRGDLTRQQSLVGDFTFVSQASVPGTTAVD